jgi:hypothetical protein
MDYAIELQGKVYTPDGKVELTPEQVAQHNAALASAELAEWAKAPDRWQVYVTKGKREVTTWTGEVLGTIIERTAFRTNLSRNIVAIRFRGTNGAVYYGRYGADWSMLCRVRKAKG